LWRAGAALGVALAAVTVASTSASGSEAATSRGAAAPASISTLIARSHHEQGLIIYGNAPAPYFKPVVAAFEQQYPWIAVQDNDLSDFQVFSKYESEHAQGSTSADILIASGIDPGSRRRSSVRCRT
jgi:iron(III) transport system substrate-binding protein